MENEELIFASRLNEDNEALDGHLIKSEEESRK